MIVFYIVSVFNAFLLRGSIDRQAWGWTIFESFIALAACVMFFASRYMDLEDAERRGRVSILRKRNGSGF